MSGKFYFISLYEFLRQALFTLVITYRVTGYAELCDESISHGFDLRGLGINCMAQHREAAGFCDGSQPYS